MKVRLLEAMHNLNDALISAFDANYYPDGTVLHLVLFKDGNAEIARSGEPSKANVSTDLKFAVKRHPEFKDNQGSWECTTATIRQFQEQNAPTLNKWLQFLASATA